MVELATVPRPRGVCRAARCSNMLGTHALARVEAPPHSPAERRRRSRPTLLVTVFRLWGRPRWPDGGTGDGPTPAWCVPSGQMLKHAQHARTRARGSAAALSDREVDSGTRRCSRRRLRGHGVGRGGPTVDLSTVPSPYDGMRRVWWLGARPAAAFRSTWSELAPLSSPRVNANVNGKPLW